jgi:hypothetical protein
MASAAAVVFVVFVVFMVLPFPPCWAVHRSRLPSWGVSHPQGAGRHGRRRGVPFRENREARSRRRALPRADQPAWGHATGREMRTSTGERPTRQGGREGPVAQRENGEDQGGGGSPAHRSGAGRPVTLRMPQAARSQRAPVQGARSQGRNRGRGAAHAAERSATSAHGPAPPPALWCCEPGGVGQRRRDQAGQGQPPGQLGRVSEDEAYGCRSTLVVLAFKWAHWQSQPNEDAASCQSQWARTRTAPRSHFVSGPAPLPWLGDGYTTFIDDCCRPPQFAQAECNQARFAISTEPVPLDSIRESEGQS